MNGFYNITTAMFTELEKAGFRVITLGDYFKVDLNRQTVFPYAHIVPLSSRLEEGIIPYGFSIIGMDLIDFNKDDLRDQTQPFYSVDNLQDVLNDIHNRLSLALEQFVRGDQYSLLFQVNDLPSYTPFFKRYENLLAGWEVTLEFKVANDTPIC